MGSEDKKTRAGKDGEIDGYSWNNTVAVLHSALGGSRQAAEESAHILRRRELRGTVSAQLLEEYFQEKTRGYGSNRTTHTIVVMELVAV